VRLGLHGLIERLVGSWVIGQLVGDFGWVFDENSKGK
jgi:hypothetical protein